MSVFIRRRRLAPLVKLVADFGYDGGRIALVRAISSYNATEPVPGPGNRLIRQFEAVAVEYKITTDGAQPDRMLKAPSRCLGRCRKGERRRACHPDDQAPAA